MSTRQADAQAQWVRWIWGAADAAAPDGLRPLGPYDRARGLSAYREHAKALAVRALAARFPLLQAWLGEQEFAGLAWAFARQHPPRSGDLNAWGDGIEAFLRAQPGMEPEPPLLAAIDDALHRLHRTADEAQDDALWQQLQAVEPARLRLRWSEALQGFTVPESLRELLEPGNETPGAAGATLLVWRRGWKPCRGWIGGAMEHWLGVQGSAVSLAGAVELQLAVHPDFDFGAALHLAWQQGWLLGVEAVAASA